MATNSQLIKNAENFKNYSSSFNDYKRECECGWSISTREKKGYDLLCRLHKKKCEIMSLSDDKLHIYRKMTDGNGNYSTKLVLKK